MNLYEINSALENCWDEETGEILDSNMMEELEMAKEEKIENICLYIKNLTSDVEALKIEKDSFAKRQKSAENKIDGLKKYLAGFLDGEKFKSTRATVSYRKSESLNIDNASNIPEEFWKKRDPEVDKTGLKKFLKLGNEVPGVKIVEKQNIQIK